MTDHLPECPAPSEYGGGEYHIYDERPCICDRLRACEQRIRDNEINKAWLDGEEYGLAAGLSAARDAVYAMPWDEDFTPTNIFAAIDALRGESNG